MHSPGLHAQLRKSQHDERSTRVEVTYVLLQVHVCEPQWALTGAEVSVNIFVMIVSDTSCSGAGH